MEEYVPNKPTLKQLAKEDRPREKMLNKGRRELTNAELLAILLSSGNTKKTAVELAQEILSAYDNDLNALAKLEVKELKKFLGVGEAKAITIIAAMELGRRREGTGGGVKQKIRDSRDLFQFFNPMLSDLGHEEFWVAYLNKSNTPVAKQRISAGGVAGTVVDIKIILKEAVAIKSCTSIAICHNHPSGNLQPSENDIKLTGKIKDAARLMDLVLLDHIIIGEKGYYSFADEGIL